jgi:hypothetical protein
VRDDIAATTGAEKRMVCRITQHSYGRKSTGNKLIKCSRYNRQRAHQVQQEDLSKLSTSIAHLHADAVWDALRHNQSA